LIVYRDRRTEKRVQKVTKEAKKIMNSNYQWSETVTISKTSAAKPENAGNASKRSW